MMLYLIRNLESIYNLFQYLIGTRVLGHILNCNVTLPDICISFLSTFIQLYKKYISRNTVLQNIPLEYSSIEYTVRIQIYRIYFQNLFLEYSSIKYSSIKYIFRIQYSRIHLSRVYIQNTNIFCTFELYNQINFI